MKISQVKKNITFFGYAWVLFWILCVSFISIAMSRSWLSGGFVVMGLFCFFISLTLYGHIGIPYVLRANKVPWSKDWIFQSNLLRQSFLNQTKISQVFITSRGKVGMFSIKVPFQQAKIIIHRDLLSNLDSSEIENLLMVEFSAIKSGFATFRVLHLLILFTLLGLPLLTLKYVYQFFGYLGYRLYFDLFFLPIYKLLCFPINLLKQKQAKLIHDKGVELSDRLDSLREEDMFNFSIFDEIYLI